MKREVELLKRMLICSKMDKILVNGFHFDGRVRSYLVELDFEQARAVFMIRFRMLPTKTNFPGRWSGTLCNVCGFEDTDAHLFVCPGYQDIITNDIWYDMFWDDSILNDTAQLKEAAKILLSVIQRLEQIQDIKFKI